MEKQIGTVTHYYSRLSVAVLNLTAEIHQGDEIHIRGRITDLQMKVDSLEIEHTKVETAAPGAEVALKVDGYVREGDVVYKLME
jgi:hypothetical protein